MSRIPTQRMHDETTVSSDDLAVGNVLFHYSSIAMSGTIARIFIGTRSKQKFLVRRIFIFFAGWSMGTLFINVLHI